jgi:hypothetical protein
MKQYLLENGNKRVAQFETVFFSIWSHLKLTLLGSIQYWDQPNMVSKSFWHLRFSTKMNQYVKALGAYVVYVSMLKEEIEVVLKIKNKILN